MAEQAKCIDAADNSFQVIAGAVDQLHMEMEQLDSISNNLDASNNSIIDGVASQQQLSQNIESNARQSAGLCQKNLYELNLVIAELNQIADIIGSLKNDDDEKVKVMSEEAATEITEVPENEEAEEGNSAADEDVTEAGDEFAAAEEADAEHEQYASDDGYQNEDYASDGEDRNEDYVPDDEYQDEDYTSDEGYSEDGLDEGYADENASVEDDIEEDEDIGEEYTDEYDI